jgi:hypothetical protein
MKQWPYLVAYLRHGMTEIDINYVENIIRDIALGKKTGSVCHEGGFMKMH